MLFADDFEFLADCTLFFTASEENSNESRFALLAAVPVFEVGVFDGVCFAVGVERVNVSRLGAEEIGLLCVGVLVLETELEREADEVFGMLGFEYELLLAALDAVLTAIVIASFQC